MRKKGSPKQVMLCAWVAQKDENTAYTVATRFPI